MLCLDRYQQITKNYETSTNYNQVNIAHFRTDFHGFTHDTYEKKDTNQQFYEQAASLCFRIKRKPISLHFDQFIGTFIKR